MKVKGVFLTQNVFAWICLRWIVGSELGTHTLGHRLSPAAPWRMETSWFSLEFLQRAAGHFIMVKVGLRPRQPAWCSSHPPVVTVVGVLCKSDPLKQDNFTYLTSHRRCFLTWNKETKHHTVGNSRNMVMMMQYKQGTKGPNRLRSPDFWVISHAH